MIDLVDAQVVNRQDLGMAGPDGATLWVSAGTARIGFYVVSTSGAFSDSKEVYRLLVGPVLAAGAHAVGIAWAAKVTIADGCVYSVDGVEADIDDESGRVQLTFEAYGRIPQLANTTAWREFRIDEVSYQVTIRGTAAV